MDSTLELLRCLKDPQQQRAVINADDEHFAAAAAAAGAVPRITYGINNPAADVRAESISLTLWQTTVRANCSAARPVLSHHAAPLLVLKPCHASFCGAGAWQQL